jgi:hypothetical protein
MSGKGERYCNGGRIGRKANRLRRFSSANACAREEIMRKTPNFKERHR